MTEAYSILGDPDKRARYDQLIFGDTSSAYKDFTNQDSYEYWKDKDASKQHKDMHMKEPYEKQQERIREKLKNYTDYNDFLKRFDHHREKH